MAQKIITIDPKEFDSILIQLKAKELPHFKGEQGIDVSRHNGPINWPAMAGAGVGFTGIRATLGASGVDDQFKNNWLGAKAAGIQRMAYMYFTNNVLGVPQANNLLSVLGSDLGELPFVVDVEPAASQIITNKTSNTDEILACLKKLELHTEIRATIYTNSWAWSACTTVPTWSNTYELWLAAYTTAPTPKIPPPWTTAKIWQYDNKGNIAGTSPLDLNRWGPY